MVKEEEGTVKEEEEGRGLLSLPQDLLLTVLSFLDPPELLQLGSCCRFLRLMARSDALWMRHCAQRYAKARIDFARWRATMDSAVLLYRLLSSFAPFVGPWTVKGREPRGSLLYITWESLSLVAYNVFTSNTDVLQRRRVFKIVGERNGCFHVEIFSNEDSLAGELSWTSKMESEFTVEAHTPNDGSKSRLGGTSFSQRALQYLIQLSSPGRNNLAPQGGQNEEMDDGFVFRCSCTKLVVSETSASSQGDILGLWHGNYGPHGTEIINVTQTNEEVVGIKVLGDPNVPCGQPTFRADVSMELLEVSVELQQIVDSQLSTGSEHFNIAKVYKGDGRIAAHNYRNPSWVPGHLLVSRRGEIAFLWEDINLVVFFHRVNLALLCEH